MSVFSQKGRYLKNGRQGEDFQMKSERTGSGKSRKNHREKGRRLVLLVLLLGVFLTSATILLLWTRNATLTATRFCCTAIT